MKRGGRHDRRFFEWRAGKCRRACRRCAVLAGIVVASVAGPPLAAAGELNIYSHRQQFLLQPFLDAFTAETGIKANVVYASKGLAQRLLAEGEASPADVILTVDIARLSEYAELDLLAVVDSPVLKANIPASLRANDDRWFAFSTRARLVATSKDRVAADAIADIEDLADPKWAGPGVQPQGEAMSIIGRCWPLSLPRTVADVAEEWAEGLWQISRAGRRAMTVRRPRPFSRANATSLS